MVLSTTRPAKGARTTISLVLSSAYWRARSDRERPLELRVRRIRQLERQVVLFSVDTRQELIAQNLQLRASNVMVRLRQRTFIGRPGHHLIGLLLLDLAVQIVEFRLLVKHDPLLVLRIELDQDIARLHMRSRTHQASNDQGRGRLPSEAGNDDRAREHGLNGPRQANRDGGRRRGAGRAARRLPGAQRHARADKDKTHDSDPDTSHGTRTIS
jgi:hypothetical protein